MSTIEEAREHARKALARYESQSARDPFHFGLEDHMYVALRALLDATEPSAPLSIEDFITGTTDGEVDTDEFFADLDERPAEDEREALANVLLDGRDADEGLSALRDRILAAGYSKGPRPITDEMVKAAARVIYGEATALIVDAWDIEDEEEKRYWFDQARAALEAAEEARR